MTNNQKTDESKDKGEGTSRDVAAKKDDLLKKKSTSEAREKKKLKEQPNKMDREINLDFETEIQSEE